MDGLLYPTPLGQPLQTSRLGTGPEELWGLQNVNGRYNKQVLLFFHYSTNQECKNF